MAMRIFQQEAETAMRKIQQEAEATQRNRLEFAQIEATQRNRLDIALIEIEQEAETAMHKLHQDAGGATRRGWLELRVKRLEMEAKVATTKAEHAKRLLDRFNYADNNESYQASLENRSEYSCHGGHIRRVI